VVWSFVPTQGNFAALQAVSNSERPFSPHREVESGVRRIPLEARAGISEGGRAAAANEEGLAEGVLELPYARLMAGWFRYGVSGAGKAALLGHH